MLLLVLLKPEKSSIIGLHSTTRGSLDIYEPNYIWTANPGQMVPVTEMHGPAEYSFTVTVFAAESWHTD